MFTAKSVLVFIILLFLLSCSKKPSFIIAISQFVEHPALDAEREGILKALEDNGYGSDVQIVIENAHGNIATAQQIAIKLVSLKPQVILAIATPSAQSLAQVCQDIPLVFTAVSDPLSAKLVKSLENPGGMVTGVIDAVPITPQVELIQKLFPYKKRLGILYNPGEINAVSHVQSFEQEATAKGFDILKIAVTKTSEMSLAVKNLIEKVDILFLPQDNTVVSAINTIIKITKEHNLPVLASDINLMSSGLTAAIGFDHVEMGYRAGECAVKILKGVKPGSIPIQKDLPLKIVVK